MPKSAPEPRLTFGGIDLFEPLDTASWLVVVAFFIISSLIRSGDLVMSFLGAAGIVVIMFLVSASIEILIESLKHTRGLGTLVGFITNGPEALCLIVGLAAGDVLFAASTPLGSNIINPIMLLAAALITGRLGETLATHPRFSIPCVLATGTMAVLFFVSNAPLYNFLWALTAAGVSSWFFIRRPAEPQIMDFDEDTVSRLWFLPAIVILVLAGYLLDPVVEFTAEHSRAPKGAIGFFVLATLTSWPEFKSTLSLLRRKRALAAVLNITVSNITNIWLALTGVLVHVLGS